MSSEKTVLQRLEKAVTNDLPELIEAILDDDTLKTDAKIRAVGPLTNALDQLKAALALLKA